VFLVIFTKKRVFSEKRRKMGQKGRKRAPKRPLGTPKKGGLDVRWGAILVGSLIFYKKTSKKRKKTGFCFAAYGEKKRCFWPFFGPFLGGPQKSSKIRENHDFRFFSSKNNFVQIFFVFGHKKFFYDSKSSVMFQYGAIKSACDEKVEAMRDAEEDAGG